MIPRRPRGDETSWEDEEVYISLAAAANRNGLTRQQLWRRVKADPKKIPRGTDHYRIGQIFRKSFAGS
jgi:hypothetical protein